jgi:hypothetical protein
MKVARSPEGCDFQRTQSENFREIFQLFDGTRSFSLTLASTFIHKKPEKISLKSSLSCDFIVFPPRETKTFSFSRFYVEKKNM